MLKRLILAAARHVLCRLGSGPQRSTVAACTVVVCCVALAGCADRGGSPSAVKGAGLGTSLLIAGIRQYDSPADARREFAALVTVMRTCRRDTDTDGTR
jgi:hypothetical protein